MILIELLDDKLAAVLRIELNAHQGESRETLPMLFGVRNYDTQSSSAAMLNHQSYYILKDKLRFVIKF